jgi:hypothetical protein
MDRHRGRGISISEGTSARELPQTAACSCWPQASDIPGGAAHRDMASLEKKKRKKKKLKTISNMPSLEDLNICHCPESQEVSTDGL